jgi:hypothetical protein
VPAVFALICSARSPFAGAGDFGAALMSGSGLGGIGAFAGLGSAERAVIPLGLGVTGLIWVAWLDPPATKPSPLGRLADVRLASTE